MRATDNTPKQKASRFKKTSIKESAWMYVKSEPEFVIPAFIKGFDKTRLDLFVKLYNL